jgi:putative solute:sodium symporter small subunit
MIEHNQRKRYWKANLRYLGVLLLIWFTVSYGFGILFVDRLDRIRLGGFKLGFWFAQQGSIYVFVILIFVYVWLMNRLDRAHDVDERDQEPS